ncbi:hypothetical protein K443DRAFT_639040 [Laccaria amethystina LaAM-08-1]|uniref:Unplaced genomic scaffold K443scaffold_226, whole genome shotgun sequence n=1 Tax=Laccaria amethystina LaAM-08-1 TaxID=1095629 RepID=A0A0C9WTI9_9AGAR|nr:hypothetical protein K443DRAFT_639040 [Laccaria amethystina LaAM-08-1]
MIIQNIKTRIDDIMNLVKFVEATATEDQKESFESQLLRWRNTKTEVTAPIVSTMVHSGEQSLPNEVGTPGGVKRDALIPSCRQEAPFEENGRKRRKITTIDLTGSDHDEVTDHCLPARRDNEVSINDGRDVEHAIEIID